MANINFKKNNGYTIIETMVAVSLFLIIAVYGMGSLLTSNLVSQKTRDMRSILDNLSFILDDISRNLRTGYTYYCITGTDDLSSVAVTKSGASCWGVAFEASPTVASTDGDPTHNQWVYYIGPDTTLSGNPLAIWKSAQGPYTPTNFIKLTPDEVVIDPVSAFSVLGAEAPTGLGTGNQQQPFVAIKLKGVINLKNSIASPFSLQTSVSQRLLDVPQ